ncbi:MAG: hypothetical protein KGM43_00290, partial [Planctomycetota bacterium]|nr:hypothetical protein [Planctomycetota bacterium]
VRVTYPDEVRKARRKSSRALVVVVDADMEEVAFRHTRLDGELKLNELVPRDKGERIVVLVPRRHIETWIHYLNGNSVEEEQDYKSKVRPDRHTESAVKKLHSIRKKSWIFPRGCPPSLASVVGEFKRLITSTR